MAKWSPSQGNRATNWRSKKQRLKPKTLCWKNFGSDLGGRCCNRLLRLHLGVSVMASACNRLANRASFSSIKAAIRSTKPKPSSPSCSSSPSVPLSTSSSSSSTNTPLSRFSLSRSLSLFASYNYYY